MYLAFHARFPDIGMTEYRTVKRLDGEDVVEDILFMEMYCEEPACDCRRTLVRALSSRGGRELATLTFGWEPEAFYRTWASWELTELQLRDLKGPAIQLLQYQSERADEMLEYFEMILSDPAYVERVKRHYRMFRDQVDAESDEVPRNRSERRAARRQSKAKQRRRARVG